MVVSKENLQSAQQM